MKYSLTNNAGRTAGHVALRPPRRDSCSARLAGWLLAAALLPGPGLTPLRAQVAAWGAGTSISATDPNELGQSIIPPGLTNIVEVAGGWRHTLALRADGSLLAWGDDSLGQTNVPAGTNFTAIACGSVNSLALSADGTITGFGDFYNAYGEVFPPLGLSNVVAVACGFYHSLALQADGTVVAWGAQAGQLPPGTPPNYGQTIVPFGLTNVVAIAGGGYHSLALRADGTVAGWGQNMYGQATPPPGLANVVAIAAGEEFSLALRANGTLLAWGDNTFGQTNPPAGLTNVVAIACGGWHALALKADGTVIAWGAGAGANTDVDYAQTIVPAGLARVKQIAAGRLNSLALVGGGPPATTAPVMNVRWQTNGFTVEVPSLPGRVYQLQSRSALNAGGWRPQTLSAGTGAPLELMDPAAGGTGARFYRVMRW